MLMTLDLERALRWAAVQHHSQERRGSQVPYFEHVVAVAMILDRLGFPEAVLIAGLLHDVVEDTETPLEEVRSRFGNDVAEIVHYCSERKTDEQGEKRPWLDRKTEHLEHLEQAPLAARAVVLADKLHNLLSIQLDLHEGRPVWSSFNAGREQVLWYYRTMIDRYGQGDDRLETLAGACRQVLAELETAST
jgi:guanosine-3',5'-bis(diphosphate) 3'-pyrophosphohydrolase